jgi:hypothetical protein
VRVTRGLWLPADVADNPLVRLDALRAMLAPGVVFSDRTAAELHELWLPGHGTDSAVHVTVSSPVPAQATGPQRREVRTHRRTLAPQEIGLVAGLPVTTPARTWCDLAEVLSLPDLVAAGDSALRSAVPLADLAVALSVRHGRRGRLKARQALPLLCARARSRPESHLRVALVTAGLPSPAVNEAVHDQHGQWLAEPDLSYREARLAVEYQGADHADIDRMRRAT